MWQVEYGYYNYPKLTKEFKTYKQARWFFEMIRKKNGVKRAELTSVEV